MKYDFSATFLKKLAVLKRSKDITLITESWKYILNGLPLPPSYRDHKLKGKLKGYREYHLEGDWVVVYKITKEVVFFTNTGTHDEVLSDAE